MALYISLVEHPARLTLSETAMLLQWQPSYSAALSLQSGLAVNAGLLGLIAWYQDQNWLWLAGAVVILMNWPFTLAIMWRTNKRLMAMEPDQANSNSRKLLVHWGRLHAVRSGLGCVAAALYAFSILAGR